MYGWIFRHLPGPTWFKTIEAVLIVLALLAVLFFWVFPEVHSYINGDVTV